MVVCLVFGIITEIWLIVKVICVGFRPCLPDESLLADPRCEIQSRVFY